MEETWRIKNDKSGEVYKPNAYPPPPPIKHSYIFRGRSSAFLGESEKYANKEGKQIHHGLIISKLLKNENSKLINWEKTQSLGGSAIPTVSSYSAGGQQPARQRRPRSKCPCGST
jgi:hypothetical protein